MHLSYWNTPLFLFFILFSRFLNGFQQVMFIFLFLLYLIFTLCPQNYLHFFVMFAPTMFEKYEFWCILWCCLLFDWFIMFYLFWCESCALYIQLKPYKFVRWNFSMTFLSHDYLVCYNSTPYEKNSII